MMYEGKNIHFSPQDNKPLCSYSVKLCKQRRLNGYALCLRHVLEDPEAPFRRCPYMARNKLQCTNPIQKTNNAQFCTSHMQLVGLLPKLLPVSNSVSTTTTTAAVTKVEECVVRKHSRKRTLVAVDEPASKKMDQGNDDRLLTSLNPYTFSDADKAVIVSSAGQDVVNVATQPSNVTVSQQSSNSTTSLKTNGLLFGVQHQSIPISRLYPELTEKLEKDCPTPDRRVKPSVPSIPLSVVVSRADHTSSVDTKINHGIIVSIGAMDVKLPPYVNHTARPILNMKACNDIRSLGSSVVDEPPQLASATATNVPTINRLALLSSWLAGSLAGETSTTGVVSQEEAMQRSFAHAFQCLLQSPSATALFVNRPVSSIVTGSTVLGSSPSVVTNFVPGVPSVAGLPSCGVQIGVQSEVAKSSNISDFSASTLPSTFIQSEMRTSLSPSKLTNYSSSKVFHTVADTASCTAGQSSAATSVTSQHNLILKQLPHGSPPLTTFVRNSRTKKPRARQQSKANSSISSTAKLSPKNSANPLFSVLSSDVLTQDDDIANTTENQALERLWKNNDTTLQSVSVVRPKCAARFKVDDVVWWGESSVRRPVGTVGHRVIQSLISRHTKQRVYDSSLLSVGVDSSDEEDVVDSDTEDWLPRQRIVCDRASCPTSLVDNDDNDCYVDNNYTIAEDCDNDEDNKIMNSRHTPWATKCLLLSSALRRRFTQLEYSYRGNTSAQCRHRIMTDIVVAAARQGIKETGDVLRRIKRLQTNAISNRKRKYSDVLLRQRPCLCNDAANDVACKNVALPYSNHCIKHIMYNVDQQLFDYCTAKFADNTQCCVPVFDIQHDLPLCAEHAAKADSYERHDSVKPKKQRKKTKPSALTRPSKKKKKRKKCSVKLIALPDQINSSHMEQLNKSSTALDPGHQSRTVFRETADIDLPMRSAQMQKGGMESFVAGDYSSLLSSVSEAETKDSLDVDDEDAAVLTCDDDLGEPFSPGTIERHLALDTDQATSLFDYNDLHLDLHHDLHLDLAFKKMSEVPFDLLEDEKAIKTEFIEEDIRDEKDVGGDDNNIKTTVKQDSTIENDMDPEFVQAIADIRKKLIDDGMNNYQTNKSDDNQQVRINNVGIKSEWEKEEMKKNTGENCLNDSVNRVVTPTRPSDSSPVDNDDDLNDLASSLTVNDLRSIAAVLTSSMFDDSSAMLSSFFDGSGAANTNSIHHFLQQQSCRSETALSPVADNSYCHLRESQLPKDSMATSTTSRVHTNDNATTSLEPCIGFPLLQAYLSSNTSNQKQQHAHSSSIQIASLASGQVLQPSLSVQCAPKSDPASSVSSGTCPAMPVVTNSNQTITLHALRQRLFSHPPPPYQSLSHIQNGLRLPPSSLFLSNQNGLRFPPVTLSSCTVPFQNCFPYMPTSSLIRTPITRTITLPADDYLPKLHTTISPMSSFDSVVSSILTSDTMSNSNSYVATVESSAVTSSSSLASASDAVTT